MRALQVISFLALMMGAGGVENQNGEYQPVSIGITFAALIVVLIISRKENHERNSRRTEIHERILPLRH